MTLRQKAQKALWFFIALLAATSAAQGYYLRGGAAAPVTAAAAPDAGSQDPWDGLFDDDFFKASFDPFPLFGQPWDGRLLQRMEMPAISAKTEERKKEVVVELSVPGLDKDSLNLSVDDSGIRIACDARTVQEKKDGSGREMFRGESTRHFEQVFPIPDDADGRASRIERKGDLVKVIFPRLEHAVKADA